MGNLSGLFGSSQDAYSIMLDPFFFLFWVTGKKQFCILFSQPAPGWRVLFCFQKLSLEAAHAHQRWLQPASDVPLVLWPISCSFCCRSYCRFGMVKFEYAHSRINFLFKNRIFIIPRILNRVLSRLYVLNLLVVTHHPGGFMTLVAG